MKHVKFWIRVVCFLGVLCLLLVKYFDFIMPEFYTDSWPITSTFEGFYNLEEDTADVLFLGSSHGASGFMPQELYDNYKITSYNLSSEQQNLVITYYWLREALSYQTPKVVVLEAFITFPFNQKFYLNTEEACTRKTIDAMKWSKNKVALVNDICRLDETQDKLSYYLPNLRYHNRWEKIEDIDYTHDEMMEFARLFGSYAIDYSCNRDYFGYDMSVTYDEEQMVPIMKEYLEKIVDLCNERQIKLLFTMNPTSVIRPGQCQYYANYCKERGIDYIDFNDENVLNEIAYDFAVDNADIGHQNIRGARKVTNYIGYKLANEYSLCEHADAQWEANKKYYSDKYNECNLTRINDIDEYLDAIKSDSLTIFMAIRDEGSMALTDFTKDKLKEFGISTDFNNMYRKSFIAVKDKTKPLYEASGEEALEYSCTFKNDTCFGEVYSAGYLCGDVCSIKIDGKEYSKQSRGINIVVFSNEKRKVIDSVSFDACIQGCPIRR